MLSKLIKTKTGLIKILGSVDFYIRSYAAIVKYQNTFSE